MTSTRGRNRNGAHVTVMMMMHGLSWVGIALIVVSGVVVAQAMAMRTQPVQRQVAIHTSPGTRHLRYPLGS